MEVQPPRRMISLTIMLLLCPNLIPAFTFSTVSTPASISSLRNNQMQMPMNSIQSSLPSQFQFQFQLNAIAEAMPSSQMSSSDNSNRKKKPMSFEERMRELALRRSTTPARISGPPSRRQRTSTSTSTQNARPANLLLVETLEDYKQVVGEENQQITVVRFFATWCKSCKAMAPKYYRLAHQYPHIKFVDVPITNNNSNLHQGLGVPSVPFGHIYHPQAGLVEELKISRKYFDAFSQKLQIYDEGCCDLSEDEVDLYGANPFKVESDDPDLRP